MQLSQEGCCLPHHWLKLFVKGGAKVESACVGSALASTLPVEHVIIVLPTAGRIMSASSSTRLALDQGAEADETKLQWLGLGMPIGGSPPNSSESCLLLLFVFFPPPTHASMAVDSAYQQFHSGRRPCRIDRGGGLVSRHSGSSSLARFPRRLLLLLGDLHFAPIEALSIVIPVPPTRDAQK